MDCRSYPSRGFGPATASQGRDRGVKVRVVLDPSLGRVSYLFGGRTDVNLKSVLEKLRKEFGIKKLLLEGGSATQRPRPGRVAAVMRRVQHIHRDAGGRAGEAQVDARPSPGRRGPSPAARRGSAAGRVLGGGEGRVVVGLA